MTLRCPICHGTAGERPLNRFFPFCSDRCRLLDLGKWFDGQYRVPGPPASDDPAGPEGGEGSGQPADS